MTMVTPNATPKRLKKRNVAKLGTAGVAVFAGAALAASTFGLTQAASAFYTPEYVEADPEYTFVAASDESVIFDDRDDNRNLTNIGQGGGTVYSGTWQAEMVNSVPSAEFSIVNNSDERAIVYLDGAALRPAGVGIDNEPFYDPDEVEAFENLFVTIVDRNESSSRNREANAGVADTNNNGRIDEGDDGYRHQTIVENVRLDQLDRYFIADVAERFRDEGLEPDGRPQTGYDYDVYLTSPVETVPEGEIPASEQRELDWDFTYDAYGYEPGNFADQQDAYFRAGFDGNGGNSSTSPLHEGTDQLAEQFPNEDEYEEFDPRQS